MNTATPTDINFPPVNLPKDKALALLEIKARKLVEKALRMPGSNGQTIFENSSVGFMLTDKNGLLNFFNNAAKEFLFPDIEAKDIIGKSVFDFINPAKSTKYKDSLTQAMHGETIQYHFEHAQKNKQNKWLNIVLKPVYKAGKIEGLCITCAGITLQKTAQLQLEKSELFYENVLNSLNAGIAIINNTGLVIAVNKTWDDFAKENEAVPLKRTSIGSNYFDVCKKAALKGDTTASQALEGILSVFRKEKDIFELEYPCHSPQEKRWFILMAVIFGSDDSKVVISHHNITKRKLAEISLYKEKASMRDFFENAPQAIAIIDADNSGKFIGFNNNTLKLLGFTSRDFLNKTFLDISPPYQTDGSRSDKKARDYMIATLAGEKPVFNWLLIDACGKEIFGEVHLAKFSGIEENHVLASIYDVTAHVKSKAALLQSESSLTSIIENTDALIYSLDTDYRYVTFNKGISRSLKIIYDLDIKPGDHIYNFLEKLEPEELVFWKSVYEKAFKGEILKFEKEYRVNNFHKDNSCFHFSLHPIRVNKKVIGLSCFAVDITKQKQMINALSKSEAQYRQIVETAQEGIWAIDENNLTTFVNKKMCEILEYTEAEMVGKEHFYFMESDTVVIVELALERRKMGIKENYDIQFITKSGKTIWANISANPIFDQAGKYRGALGMVSDITDNKNLQQQLLEEQINNQKEITKAVVNAQEKERTEIGEELHDNVNQLLAAAGMCLNQGLSENVHNAFIVKSQEYIGMAMEEIRKLSHALVGPKQNNTLALIDSIEELIYNIEILKDIKITFSFCTYREEYSDAGLKLVIYRIIQEQVGNILKHAEASEVDLKLKMQDNDLLLIINDNGKGFDTSATRNGIGLINIKSRAAVYDGRVQILSSIGNGCKMTIIFKNAITLKDGYKAYKK